jgi:methionyl-tRNA synthetase
MDSYQLTKAFWEIQKLLDLSNKIIHELEPWSLFKAGQKKLLHNTLNYLINGIKIIAFLLQPIMPKSSTTIFEFLNVNQNSFNWTNLLDFSQLNQIKIKKLTQHLYRKL